MKKSGIFNGMFTAAACFILIAAVSSLHAEANVIEDAVQVLKNKGIAETNGGMLFLKRYHYYLKELEKGNAYIDWRSDNNPPIYNATVFLRMMDRVMFRKITDNTLAGKDAFSGITGFFERAYLSEVDGYLDSYIIYVPHTYNDQKSCPLLVNLHGYGDSAHINPYSPAHFELLKACENRGVILVAPCGRQKLPSKPSFYVGEGERDVLQVIALVKKAYSIDEKKVYITGNSMGGYGSYSITSRHPELFAAIAPVCAPWSGTYGWPRVDLDKLKGIPVYLVHGMNDHTVPVSESRTAYDYLKNIHGNVVYREITNLNLDNYDSIFGGHNAWDYAYEGTQLLDWLLQYSKQ